MADKEHISYKPMGQSPLQAGDLKRAEQALSMLKDRWTLADVPSFEVWIAVTCYDPLKDDGGPVFQSLMFHILTHGEEKRLTIQEGGSAGPFVHHPADKRRRATRASDQRYTYNVTKKNPDGQINYAPITQTKTPLKGGSTAKSGTSESRGFEAPYEGNVRARGSSEKYAWQLQTIGASGCGFIAWSESSGQSRTMRTTNGTCTAQTNARQFSGTASDVERKSGGKSDTERGNNQNDGCLYQGNRMAAYYGLYFYPGCREPDWNWYHIASVNQKDYYVRMRLPNPAYKMSISEQGEPYRLRVYEKATDGNWLGGDDGFEFPQLEAPSTSSNLCWDWLAHAVTPAMAQAEKKVYVVEGITSVLQAWAGFVGKAPRDDDEHPYADYKFDEERKVRLYNHSNPDSFKDPYWIDNWVAKLKNSPWDGRMHDRTTSKKQSLLETVYGVQKGELAFGWSFPAALWLYPHYPRNEKVGVSGPIAVGAGRAQKSLYQPWPDWNLDTSCYDFNYMEYDTKVLPLCAMLEAAPLMDLPNRQRYALNDEKNPPKYFTQTHKARYGHRTESAGYINALYKALTGEGLAQTAESVGQSQGSFAVVGNQPKPAPATKVPRVTDQELGIEGPFNPPQGDSDDEDIADSGAVELQQENRRQKLSAIDAMDQRPSFMSAADNEEDGDIAADKAAENKEARRALNDKVAKDTDLPLKAGSERRDKDKDGNFHFFSLAYSPWAPDDVYRKPEHGFRVNRQMEPKEVEDYREKYGAVSNLLIRSNVPAQLDFVYSDYGEELREGHFEKEPTATGRRILDMRLDSYHRSSRTPAKTEELKELFRKNMRRILSIYYDDSGSLGTFNKINSDTKRQGMNNGIYMAGGRASEKCPKVNYDKGGNELLPAVFTTAPPDRDDNPFVDNGNVWRGAALQPKTSKGWQSYVTAAVGQIRSTMTVLEWLQTPWHYEYLPYQPMNSVFKDGETYCSGCTRCSRPFFEHKHMYSTYFLSVDYTSHWQHQYWRYKERKDQDYRYAPQPFHFEEFWSKGEVFSGTRNEAQNVDAAREEIDNNQTSENGKGYHNWPTHAFLLGYERDGQGIKKVGTTVRGPLTVEWVRRKDKLPELMKKYVGGQPWTFRRYLNHTYDPEHKNTEGKNGYDALVQGVVRSAGARVCYGMQNYKLVRSIKYGNVCRDCANTLDMAPKQYMRTGRVSAQLLAITSGEIRPGATQLDTWWLPLAGVKLKDGSLFDPWFIYVQTAGLHKPRQVDGHWTEGGNRKYTYAQLKERGHIVDDKDKRLRLVDALAKHGKQKAYEELFPKQQGENKEAYLQRVADRVDLHLEKVMEYTQAKACLVRSDGVNITRVTKPAEVYVQKYYDRDPTKWSKGSEESIKAATKILKTIVDWLDRSYKPHDDDRITAKTAPLVLKVSDGGGVYNRALRDVLHETHYQMSHMDAFKREAAAPKFDPELVRVEYRGDELVVEQLVTPGQRSLKDKDVQLVNGKAVKAPTYEKLKDGTAKLVGAEMKTWRYTKDNSDWRGDDFVKEYSNTHAVAAYRQLRRLTQSRVFITYSLHRRVFSELEARSVLETMGDAVRRLFGNDQDLCQHIVFGQRLRNVGGGDSVSSMTYVPIDKPRKAEMADKFYGGPGGRNSYTSDRYMTHVESVTVDAGMEIGPTYHHPHFHALLTVNHWSYVQFDTFKMKATLEQMFKGTHKTYGDEFKLIDGAGLPFYTDNENPYVDIRLFPSDNWAEVVAAYVRKGADKESMMALRARTGNTRVAGAQSISGGT